ncbi:hypothetical protein IE53DRAFT_388008 [Violaceomyces palustris]|uniref:Uncharacterized protein n=1 Tax=Violaceomyces palustris TaxID=1673888 RepID=A0ACD0NVA0_9BASI|nr:hypothetical protein IE53DRAFT_388008 [Violaceomyces palustris]
MSHAPSTKEINSLLEQARQNQTDIETFANLIPLALDYVSYGEGKRNHRLCQKDGAPDFELQSCMLRCFSFRSRDQVEEWRQILASTIYGGCIECYKGFVAAKEHLRKVYLSTFPQEKIAGFFAFVDSWEQDLALEALKRNKIGPKSGLGSLSPAELYSVLSLAASKSAEPLRAKLREAMTPHRLVTLSEVPAGFLVFCVDPDPNARGFTQQNVNYLRPLPPAAVKNALFVSAIEQVVARFNLEAFDDKRLAWSGLQYVLRLTPSSSSQLAHIILNHVHDRGDHLPEVLRAYSILLKLRGPMLWEQQGNGDQEYPTVILSGILDNPSFTEPLFDKERACKDPKEHDLYFTWMPAHLRSLKECTGPEFNEALKRLANFLFERMQQGHVPGESRSRAMKEGIELVLGNADEENSRQVVDIYSTGISSLAFRQGSADLVTRSAARDLVLQAFERDANSIARGMVELSRLSLKHGQRWKARNKMRRGPNPELAPTPDEIYTQAASDAYPSASICSKLWSEAYKALDSKSGKEGAAVFIRALSIVSVYSAPNLSSHLLKETPGSLAYEAYEAKVRTCVTGLTRSMKLMRQDFAEVFPEFGEIVSEDELQALCCTSAQSLLLLNLSPEPSIHKTAQALLRQAFTDVESRADCFRILFQISTGPSLRGLVEYLNSFVNAAKQLVEANELAKWTVRSFADILSVLCGSTEGLLRAGTPFSFLDNGSALQSVASSLPEIWEMMCQSLSVIFLKTPDWSKLLAREEMLAWFRDVTIFASEMVDALPTFQNVIRASKLGPTAKGKIGDSDEEVETDPLEDAMTAHLAIPVESATSWLRMNEEEVLRETQSFIHKALEKFSDGVEFPESSRNRMLSFVNEQMAIENPEDRFTLLTMEELADLKLRLEPEMGVITITDSEEEGSDDSGIEEIDMLKVKEKQEKPAEVTSHWWTNVGKPVASKSLSASQEERKKKIKMRQQKLSFVKIDPSKVIDVDALPSSSAPTKSVFSAIPNPFASSSKPASQAGPPINAYKGASASSKTSKPTIPKSSGGKISQLRQELRASKTSVYKPPVRNPVPARMLNKETNDELPRAPAAVSSVTGALAGKVPATAGKIPPADSDSSSSSSSSDDSSDEEVEAKGLAALSKKRSPIKMRKPIQVAPRRQLKVLEDPLIAKARLERMEAERKRKLRAAPDYTDLHRSILVWDYYFTGDKPPAPAGKEPPYRSVPSTLANANDYGQVFGPLLLLECWAQFQAAKEDVTNGTPEVVPIEVAGRSSVDRFVEINATIPPNSVHPQYRLSDTDIVFLREVNSVGAPKPRVVLAKVTGFKRSAQGHQVGLRCCLTEDRQGVSSTLVNRSRWELCKLFALTTLHREFAALMTAEYYDLFPDVLRARVAPKRMIAPDEVRKAMEGYAVNEPQARAILGSLGTEGFSLIQGPPGTGKTKTICALIGAFVSRRKAPATSIHAGRAGVTAPTKKILLCAPSNAAIDEVAKRAKAGMRNADGKMIHPKVIRIGRDEGINVSVKDISLEYLIEQALSDPKSEGATNTTSTDPSVLHNEIHSLKRQREEKQAELSQVRNNAALVQQLEDEIKKLSAKRLAVMSRLDEVKDKAQSDQRREEADRRRVRGEILADADVICTTLAGAGHEMLNSLPFDFETVVIDEAAQAVELSTLIPLRYGCKQCILVGDPNQLPPTVISQQAERLKYSQSLFVRMFERSEGAVHLLSIQYRMHPEISVFPSTTFYDSQLKDGPNMAQLTSQPWHRTKMMKPFRFFSTKGLESPGRGHSLINKEEVNVALAIYERLRLDYPRTDFDYRVGIVTMYKAQVFELKNTFKSRYGADILQRIDFNTVDGFQGQEKDIIILCCVRSNTEFKGIGFLSDRRRVNVAITRAKSNLFIVGNADYLRRDSLWGKLVGRAEEMSALIAVNVKSFSKPSLGDEAGVGSTRFNEVGFSNGNGRSIPNGDWTNDNKARSEKKPPPTQVDQEGRKRRESNEAGGGPGRVEKRRKLESTAVKDPPSVASTTVRTDPRRSLKPNQGSTPEAKVIKPERERTNHPSSNRPKTAAPPPPPPPRRMNPDRQAFTSDLIGASHPGSARAHHPLASSRPHQPPTIGRSKRTPDPNRVEIGVGILNGHPHGLPPKPTPPTLPATPQRQQHQNVKPSSAALDAMFVKRRKP